MAIKEKAPKQIAMLNLFVEKGTAGLNCFEAANFHHDYVLRTTVSDLQRKYGLIFLRKMESVPNAFGGKTECKRYWLDEVSIGKVRKILGS